MMKVMMEMNPCLSREISINSIILHIAPTNQMRGTQFRTSGFEKSRFTSSIPRLLKLAWLIGRDRCQSSDPKYSQTIQIIGPTVTMLVQPIIKHCCFIDISCVCGDSIDVRFSGRVWNENICTTDETVALIPQESCCRIYLVDLKWIFLLRLQKIDYSQIITFSIAKTTCWECCLKSTKKPSWISPRLLWTRVR